MLLAGLVTDTIHASLRAKVLSPFFGPRMNTFSVGQCDYFHVNLSDIVPANHRHKNVVFDLRDQNQAREE